MTFKPTNKLLYDAIKDRGTAYLMVFRELKARCGDAEAKDAITPQPFSAPHSQ